MAEVIEYEKLHRLVETYIDSIIGRAAADLTCAEFIVNLKESLGLTDEVATRLSEACRKRRDLWLRRR